MMEQAWHVTPHFKALKMFYKDNGLLFEFMDIGIQLQFENIRSLFTYNQCHNYFTIGIV